MTRIGVDYSMSRPGVAALRAAGYTFACRYLAAGSAKTAAKALTRAEADQLRAGGIDLVSNWEVAARAALKGRAQGVADARAAAAAHLADGGPPGRPIYFSADWDASEAEQPAINAYFQGVASVIGLARTGAYGGYWVIKRLFDAGLIKWGWQTYAWSGGHWDTRAQLRQIKNGITVGGADCDKDQAMADDFGQWGYEGDDVALSDADKAWIAAEIKGGSGGLTTDQLQQWLGDGVDGRNTPPTSVGSRPNLKLVLDKLDALSKPAVQVDANAVAAALAGNAGFLKALAKAVNDDAAARLAS